MSNSSKLNDLAIARLLEDDDEFSDVDDEIADPDFCLQDSDTDDIMSIEDDEASECDVSDEYVTKEIDNSNEQENGEDAIESMTKYFYGKNGYKWSAKEPSRCSKTPLHNIVRLPKALQQNPDDGIIGIWSRFFDRNIENLILEHTNTKLKAKFDKSQRTEAKCLDIIELRAFFGILIYSSVFKSNHEDTRLIFATDGTGRPIFRSTMSEERFLCILSCLRFDDSTDRKERLLTDPLAAVSELFNKFIENCQKNYTIGTHGCIDEMLVPFRGRCRFKMYMPNKPAKYGIKIMALTDARTQYLANAYIYHGKNSDGNGLTTEERRLSVPTQAVLRLTKIIEGSNRNITADNWFSSIQVIEELKKRQLTYLGTLKKNKREIPPEFLPNKNRPAGSCLYGFTKEVTILSYVPHKNKAVLLLSSMHHREEIDVQSGKPAIIADYNNTKGGVDELDKKCSIYSSNRRTRRWPLAIFYRLLDISAANAYVIYQSCAEFDDKSRADFLKSLGRQLVLPHLQRRQHNPRLPKLLRDNISSILGPDSVASPLVEPATTAKKLCYICPSRLKRKTPHVCLFCTKPMCMGCSKRLCVNCANKEFDE